MLFFAFLLPFFVALVQAQFSCSSFWPPFTPSENIPTDWSFKGQCRIFPGYPKTIGNTNVTVIYEQSWVGIELVAPVLEETLAKSISYYGTFSILPFEIIVVITNEVIDTVSADTIYPAGSEHPCQVKTYRRWSENAVTNVPRALQAIAHEIYHCVQQYTMGPSFSDPNGPSSLWVIEGSANYFSNLVFPNANVEWEETYNPVLPIYAQPGRGVYAMSIFFQALEQQKGLVYLHEWAIKTEETWNEEEERARLSTLPGFTDDFFIFAKQFSLGTVMDTSGVLIPTLASVFPAPVQVQLDSSGTLGTVSLQATTFTVSLFEFSIDSGQTVALYSSANSNQRVAYRQPEQKVWNEMPSGPATGSQGYSVLPCKEEGNPAPIQVLFISTADTSHDTVRITVAQQSQDPNCECKQNSGFQRRGLQDCKKPVTNPAPPSSSSSASPSSSNSAPAPSGTGSCVATNIATDPCLTAHSWKLDLPSMKERLEEQLSNIPGATIDNVALSGSGILTIEGTTGTFTYDNMQVSYDVSADVLEFSSSVLVNGNFKANVFTTSGGGGSGNMCLDVYAGQGTAVTTDSLTGGFTIDLGPEGGFVRSDYIIQYTCSTGVLTMQGYLNGVSSWGPYVYIN